MQGYTIITEKAIITKNASLRVGSQLSHDWGGEFYYNLKEAKDRKKELEEIAGNKFFVVPAVITF